MAENLVLFVRTNSLFKTIKNYIAECSLAFLEFLQNLSSIKTLWTLDRQMPPVCLLPRTECLLVIRTREIIYLAKSPTFKITGFPLKSKRRQFASILLCLDVPAGYQTDYLPHCIMKLAAGITCPLSHSHNILGLYMMHVYSVNK